MKRHRAFLVILLLVGSALYGGAQEQTSPDGKRVCTDLSGSVTIPCPGDRKTATIDALGADEGQPAGSTSERRSVAPISQPRSKAVTPERRSGAVEDKTSPIRPASIRQPIGQPYDDPDATASSAVPLPPVEPETAIRPSSGSYRAPERALLRNLFADQKAIWGSPLRVRLDHVQWLVPLLGGTAAVIAGDASIQREVPVGASFRKQSNRISNYGAAGFAGITGATWLWGVAARNDHMRETGVLSGEAALDSFALTYAIKGITQRDRPFEGTKRGDFFSRGDSFPSEHAAAAWSVATVFAHEYPGPLTKLLAYGGAAAVSAARVTANKHFASDALVGSALGYFIGRQVYRAHHDGGNPDSAYGTFERTRSETSRGPENMGSTYVALDSWVYDAIDRLAALGYIHSAFAGLRPWTRMEFARLLDEADSRIHSGTDSGDSSSEATRLYQSLQAEFALESRRLSGGRNLSAELESIYTRFTGISGKPLNDSYHFGQTIINDYGRPYQQGFNMITGFTSHAEAGPLAFYVRGEYQHAPSAPALPIAAGQAIAAADFLPFAPPGSSGVTIDRSRLLDAYVAMNLANWQFSFGKQSLWWGPGQGGPMMFGNNVEPVNMLRISRVAPFKLPSILGWLGPIRSEYFLGRLSGYQFVLSPSGLVGQFGSSLDSQPFIHGQKINFKPTPNLELGFSRTTIYGGPGYPLTARSFFRSMFSTHNTVAGTSKKPGDRRAGMDFSYRLPGLRNWVTFYGDGFTEDEYSPIAYADRSIWHAGLYFSHLPRIPKLDLRVEGVYSDNPLGGALGPGYYYFNGTWRDGYRNEGNLIGNWIGRAGQGAQSWATYHLSPKNSVQLNFRHQKVSREFISGGGTLTDFGLRADLWLRSDISFSGLTQYERWTFPVLAAGAQSNVTTSVQLTFWPRWRVPFK